MKMEKICIGCPAGCHLEIETDSEGKIQVSNNGCKRGIVYAENEIRDPKRVVTATVAAEGGTETRIPVRTDRPLSKGKIVSLLQTLYAIKVRHPVKRGEILIENFEQCGVNVIFTRSSEQ